MRAMYDHENSVITAITTRSPGWIEPAEAPVFDGEQAATMPTAIRICGTASSTSAMRESSVSIQPPKKPAISPTTRPIRTASPEATMPTKSEMRAPYIVRTKRSRPARVGAEPELEFGPFGTP